MGRAHWNDSGVASANWCEVGSVYVSHPIPVLLLHRLIDMLAFSLLKNPLPYSRPSLVQHLIDMLADASSTSSQAGRLRNLAATASSLPSAGDALLLSPSLLPLSQSDGGGAIGGGTAGLYQLCAELATKYSLHDLLYPWTLLYIAAIFFQGGGGGAFMVGVGEEGGVMITNGGKEAVLARGKEGSLRPGTHRAL